MEKEHYLGIPNRIIPCSINPMTKCECGQEAAIRIFTKICQICGNPKNATNMLTHEQLEELAEHIIRLLREEWGDEFTNADKERVIDFCWTEVNDKIPYPFSKTDIANTALEFELLYA